MTRIERVDVEGFKGIESLDVEPSAINVVTGRNNTGKTSLLEAIELAFDPTAIGAFKENIGTLVNNECGRAMLDLAAGPNTEQVVLSEPSPDRARDLLVEAMLSSGNDILDSLNESQAFEPDVLNAVRDEVRAIASESLSASSDEELTDEVRILDIGNQEFPLLVPLESTKQLFQDFRSNLREAIYNRTDADIDPNQFHLAEFGTTAGPTLFFDIDSRAVFLGDEPPTSDAVTFVDIPDLTDQPAPENGEADAVKVDDVEDFLVEKEIVDDLRDFDLDYLVFEGDDGEKYSVPYEFMGDGFRAIVGLLWELLDDDVSGDVVLLEEPGTHMHPGYVRELVYFLVDIAREEDVQLFLTTHNNDFISDFFNENLTDEERSFLREEFTLLQMQEDAVDVMSYEKAEEHLKDLHLDLRGL